MRSKYALPVISSMQVPVLKVELNRKQKVAIE